MSILHVCVLTTQLGSFALWGCPADKEVMDRAECMVIPRDAPMHRPRIACVDPKTKKVVYYDYVYPLQET